MHSYLPLRNTVKYIQMLFQANVLFASAQVAFLNKCISELQHWVPSSVHRGLATVFCETILIASLLTFQRLALKKTQRYKIYIHKGTAILLKPAMLQYNRVQLVPFMQQSSLTNLNPLPVKLTAQGLYPSLSAKKNNQLLFKQLKVTTGTGKKYIKCFFFLPKFARPSRLFLIKRKQFPTESKCDVSFVLRWQTRIFSIVIVLQKWYMLYRCCPRRHHHQPQNSQF